MIAMNKPLLSTCLAVLASAVCLVPAHAATPMTSHGRQTIPVTFRLTLIDPTPAGASVWVAYGPLADRFVVLPLHRTHAQTYEAFVSLPRSGRTTFAFLAGQGRVKTPGGFGPGGIPMTIERVGPLLVHHVRTLAAVWRAPVG